MKWRKRRLPERDDEAQSEGTIGDVGRGVYGPDEAEERDVWRFERTRLPSRNDMTNRQA